MAKNNVSEDVYQDKRGEWRWRRKNADGKIVAAACEGYKSKSDCASNMTRGAKKNDKWDFYQDKRGQWRWRQKASNGQVVGAATTGFKDEAAAKDNASHSGYEA